MSHHEYGSASHDERSVVGAMGRGFLNRCPHCGRGGAIFRSSFLVSEPACGECGEEFHHHRADDLPAYLVIFIVGHVVVAAFMGVETAWPLSTWQHLAIWAPVTVAASVALLRPVKGAIIGLQWALRMHGFSGEEERLESPGES